MSTYPPPALIPQTVSGRITASYGPSIATAVNLLNFRMPHEGEVTADDVNAVKDLLRTWCDAHYKFTFVGDWNIIKIETFARDNLTGPFASEAVSMSGSLLIVGSRPEHAPLILLNTGIRGRSAHGRVYTFSPDNAGVKDDNTGYTTEHMNSLVTAFVNLMEASLTSGFALAVASAVEGISNPVTGVTYSPKLTMQKRRRPGFGS